MKRYIVWPSLSRPGQVPGLVTRAHTSNFEYRPFGRYNVYNCKKKKKKKKFQKQISIKSSVKNYKTVIQKIRPVEPEQILRTS